MNTQSAKYNGKCAFSISLAKKDVTGNEKC